MARTNEQTVTTPEQIKDLQEKLKAAKDKIVTKPVETFVDLKKKK